MRFRIVTVVAMLSAAFSLTVESSRAGELFFSQRQRTRTACKIPQHNYSHNAWPYSDPKKFGSTVIAVAATDPTDADQQIKVKPFHFRATALQVDHITLDTVGLSLYESNGKLFATGRITHTGGDGGLIGNNVTIRIRAYVAHTTVAAPVVVEETLPVPPADGEVEPAKQEERRIATPNAVRRLPPDAYRVWSSEVKFWVSRGRPQHVSLVDPVDRYQDQAVLRRHFDEITHLEVELEYERDR